MLARRKKNRGLARARRVAPARLCLGVLALLARKHGEVAPAAEARGRVELLLGRLDARLGVRRLRAVEVPHRGVHEAEAAQCDHEGVRGRAGLARLREAAGELLLGAQGGVDRAALEAAMRSSRPEYVRPLLRRLAAPPPLLSAPKHQLAGYGGVGGAADDGGVDDLFALLDRLAAGAADAAATARALAVAAEALALRAGSAGGLRSYSLSDIVCLALVSSTHAPSMRRRQSLGPHPAPPSLPYVCSMNADPFTPPCSSNSAMGPWGAAVA